MRKFYLTLFLCLSLLGFSQGENDNWYFGNKAALNFSNPTTPVALNNSQMDTSEASGTVSDANGNLLFYCSPNTIWNRQHQPMLNGTGLSGGSSSQQLAIVKNPANSNQYYVFVTPEYDQGISPTNLLSYSIVDMSLGPIVNGSPLGAVLQNFRNIPVVDNLGNNFRTEAITIVAGPNPSSYWVLIPRGNNLYSYKIDNNGFSNGAPVISNLNLPSSLSSQYAYSIKASPKLSNQNFSNFICISIWANLLNGSNNDNNNNPDFINRVLSFNSNTGLINNNYALNINSMRTYLPEFNRNGSVLFLANTSIFAVNLLNSTTSNVNSLQIFNGSAGLSPANYTSLQRNKYGNIYINKHGSNFLGIINNPDVYGPNMSVTMNSLNLGTGSLARYGLPQLIPKYEPNTYYPCIDSLTLTAEPNLNFNYEIGNKITTKNRYVIDSGHDITMQAGQSVNLLPGTDIQLGAKYHAFIAPCRKESFSSKSLNSNNNQQNMVLNLDIEERKTLNKQLEIHPNPTSTFINIDSGNEKITSWELLDISGKSVLKGNSTQVNVQGLPKAAYLLKININNKITTKKVIVK
ncbi:MULTISPECIES: T9SS type A sorting domain-containing protein [Chryseobacterium]|uniref:T9SS type A sorting domain-containing protein n=1 Tax=Chryseobacterium TaxID=59732 RepID=UPI001959BF00|nr:MULTISPECIES: T9SS type A sorting domain-containing protein [Chryseobacterium]MBM7417900.1 hypothetical protein [Chryseobacterium sp. JUb44]MDH6212099.1 hypothetical protein [Chryseobacterium sp. BIGb0186]WSO10719.1 T9SS type A sorting domain-containing protein [Chryseobacterium scophthalmum]